MASIPAQRAIILTLLVCLWACRPGAPSNPDVPPWVRGMSAFSSHGAVFSSRVMPAQELTLENAEKTTRAFLAKDARGSTLSRLVIAASVEELNRSTFGLSYDGSGYSWSVLMRRPELWPVGPAARLLSVGDAALFSYREPHTRYQGQSGVREVVFSGGRDPTQLRTPHGAYRLLDFSPSIGSRPDREFLFFVKAEQRPSCPECEVLARTFVGWTRIGSLYVAIRNDAWFASQSYPAVFRFEPDNATGVRYSLAGGPTPPTVPEYYHSPMAECHLHGDMFSCEAYGMYDQVPERGFQSH
jgi:hypothetical protein